jgi:AcrR family transcriptional regulator
MQIHKDTLLRQKEIALAARKLIVKYGSEHITIRKIAQEVGVSEGAIYRHFKSKRDVLAFLIDNIENALIKEINMSSTGEVGSLTALENIMMNNITKIEQRKGVTFQVIAEIISLGDKELNKKIYTAIEKYIQRIYSILAEGVKEGIVRKDLDLTSAAQLYFSMTQGLVNLWALSQNTLDLSSTSSSSFAIFRKAVILTQD